MVLADCLLLAVTVLGVALFDLRTSIIHLAHANLGAVDSILTIKHV